jgi:adenylate cyclase
MQLTPNLCTMSEPTTQDTSWPELHRVRCAIVVVDVVESVRLMQANEADFIDRWRRLVHEVRTVVLPRYGGRMVKSLGDGMLLEFATVRQASAAALELQSCVPAYNQNREPDAHLMLRGGARLAGLAGPGEIMISTEARAQLVPGLDADVEDLGDFWVKHLAAPIRAARLGPTHPRSNSHGAPNKAAQEAIGIAILPFEARAGAPPGVSIGDLLADDLIAQLSRLPQLRVISRLSTQAFRNRAASASTIASALDVQYIVSGTFTKVSGTVRVAVQLAECSSEAVIWADTFSAPERAVLRGDEELVDRIVAPLCAALVSKEVHRAVTMPLPTLLSYSILLGAVALLHSLSLRDFERSRDMLTYLIERHPRLATPRAWLALWHVMKVGQGWSQQPASDAAIARSFVAAALDLEPNHSLSLAIDGLVCAYVHKDLATAGQRYEAALRINPNEGLAWLYQSAWYAYQEDGTRAVEGALKAQRLSPLDPMKYYYDNFTSTAMLAKGDLVGALEFGQRSLRANRLHGPTIRILAIAHSLQGEMQQAAGMVQAMRALEPGFTVSAFRQRYPGQRPAQLDRYSAALLEAGLPA